MRAAFRMCAVLLTALVMAAGCAPMGKPQEAAEAAGNTVLQEDLWFYNSFDDLYRAAYDAFDRAAGAPWSGKPEVICDEKGDPAEISAEELETVYQGFLYDHPEYFWLGASYSYRVSRVEADIEYAEAVVVIPIVDSKEKMEDCRVKFEDAVQEFLSETDLNGSDADIAKQIYEELAAGTQYVEEALYDDSYKTEHTAYGPIVTKRAVCDGYALAYKYLLNRCGIRCLPVPGETDGAPHVWNTVFWEGKWHETDLTWDAASDSNEAGQYFDLTTEEMSRDHTREAKGIADFVPVSE